MDYSKKEMYKDKIHKKMYKEKMTQKELAEKVITVGAKKQKELAEKQMKGIKDARAEVGSY